MSSYHGRSRSGTLQQRGESGNLVVSDDVAGRISNMELTPRGTLRTIVGPAEYQPAWETGQPANLNYYAEPHLGVFHTLLDRGQRDVLLAHFSNGIWAHEGWNRAWRLLVAHNPAADYVIDIPESDKRPGFLTQFESTPAGVIIVAQGDRALFYDGEVVAPLGFVEVPASPAPHSPRSSYTGGNGGLDPTTYNDVTKAAGYVHTGENMNRAMGNARIGTVRNDLMSLGATAKTNPLGGVLEAGEWRAAVQFVDYWGNVSAISGLSSSARVERDDNLTEERRNVTNHEKGDVLKVMLAWSGIDKGPEHCVARNLLRTRDLRTSGDPSLYWVSPNAVADASTYATLQDTSTSLYRDNTPDSWLVTGAIDPDPVPIFKLCRLAFGRLWVANTESEPGLLRPSAPGKWGTFPKGMEIYPDVTGAQITGLWAVAKGLLVFTEISTFLVYQSDVNPNVFLASTLHPTVGCVSPNSIATMPDGVTVWLGREGFYKFDGDSIQLVSRNIRATITRRINKAWRVKAVACVDPKMGEYRCWIPVDGAHENNVCVVFDGKSWRERDDVKAAAVCVTRDHRQYTIALGKVVTKHANAEHKSVWLLDHEMLGPNEPSPRTSSIETAWLRGNTNRDRGSPLRLTLWFRETSGEELVVEVMRDWREHPKVEGAGKSPDLHAEDDYPPRWGLVNFDETYFNDMVKKEIPRHWIKRRPFWTRLDLMVPSCETFKVRLTSTGGMEYIGMAYEEIESHGGGAKLGAR